MKNIVLWNFERGSWQWDALCLLIIAFIFLTPNSWFGKMEKVATHVERIDVKQTGLTQSVRSIHEEKIIIQ
ncbi:MAG: hypothetical protein WBD22_01485 [Pyrinomonadaceae bacterium]